MGHGQGDAWTSGSLVKPRLFAELMERRDNMFEVFIACTDRATLQKLRSAIENEADFEVCGVARIKRDVLAKVRKSKPNLIILDRKLLQSGSS
jgi:hypothetical protein